MTIERSADQLDMAQALQDDLNEAAIAAARRKSEPETHENFDGEHCVECDEDIHPARLDLGKVRCIGCQEAKEQILRRGL